MKVHAVTGSQLACFDGVVWVLAQDAGRVFEAGCGVHVDRPELKLMVCLLGGIWISWIKLRITKWDLQRVKLVC